MHEKRELSCLPGAPEIQTSLSIDQFGTKVLHHICVLVPLTWGSAHFRCCLLSNAH